MLTYTTNLYYFLPEIYLTTVVTFLVIYGIFYEKIDSIVINLKKFSWLCIIAIFFSILISMNILANITQVETIYAGLLYVDNVNMVIKIILLIALAVILLLSIDLNIKYKIFQIEYQLLVVYSTIGLLLVVSSLELIIFYLGLELSSLAVYVLATIKRHSEFSTEAGIKYFVLGGLSSGLLLFGSALLYLYTGETNIIGISYAIDLNELSVQVAIFFIFVALWFKLAAAPFHNWAPDVYEGSPNIITLYIATLPKLAILYFFINLFAIFHIEFTLILSVIIALSLIIGCVGGVIQSKFLRVLAYSAINHIAFIFLGILSMDYFGIQASLIYMVNYIIISIIFFSILMVISTSSNFYLSQFVGLSRLNPILALTLSLSLLSVAGVPPLSGFYTKLIVLFSAVSHEFYFLTFLAITTSMISTFYYLRIVQFIYFKDSDDFYFKSLALPANFQVSLITSLVLGICFYFVLTILIYPSVLNLFSFDLFSNFLI